MRKYVLILIALAFAAVIAGCGTKETTDSTARVTTEKILSADILGKNLFMVSSKNNFQLDSIATTAETGNLTGTATDPRTGNWQFFEADGTIVVTDGSGPHTFTCIQKETPLGYLLVFDTDTHEISRLYIDTTRVVDFNPAFMGGSVQGADLQLTTPSSITVSTFAGSLTGVSGFVDANGLAASFNRPMDITTDGTSFYVADYANNMIRKIDKATGAVSRLAGSSAGTAGSTDSTDATGNTAFFNLPSSITYNDSTKLLYVADTENHTIRSVDPVSGEVKTIAGVTGIAGSIDNTGTSAGFNTPTGITTDGTNLYVADTGNHTIRKIVLSSMVVTTLAGKVGSIGSDIGIPTNARFNLPSHLTTDGSNLYVGDFNNRTIRKIVIATGVVSTPFGTADTKPGAADGIGPAAAFYNIGGITCDGKNLYLTDYSNAVEDDATHTLTSPWINQIRKVDLNSKVVSTLAGILPNFTVVPKLDPNNGSNGTGAEAFFLTPIGITTDGSGLYVTDSDVNGNNIRLLKPTSTL